MDLKQFYFPGDVVTLRQEIPNKPVMIVVKKVTKSISLKIPSGEEKRNDLFQGILCRWFTTNCELQEAVFNTKDLQKV